MIEPGRNSSCRGKERFDSARLAHAVIRRGEFTHRPRDAYRCSHCGFYHIGSKLRKVDPERKREERHRYSTIAAQATVAIADDFDDLT